MHIWLSARPAGDGRTPSVYVVPGYGATSPDLTRRVKLPPTLCDLWVALSESPGQTLTYLTLTRALWPQASVADPGLVRAHVGRLRALLVQVGWPPSCLEVVWGRGVMFHAPDKTI